ncbi:vancomycin high temperature exclusion protein [Mariniflexile sp. HMF6888]|uniref:vancomycin high temperature exclusion protein n=1 Tax=Mariniflexile sp. HMF6888 TaxID=3373086 RepID=UPI003799CEE7
MKYIKKIIFLILFVFIVIFALNFWLSFQTKNSIYNDVLQIPKNKVGLVLGTSKYLSDGRINLYYQYRVEAAVSLYNANKIDFILVSGDNGKNDYDEPTDFKNDFIKHGIPEEKIFLDYAGFRTLDSVVRAKEIFNLTEFTIISQKFHNERAIYLAKHFNIKAIGFNTQDIKGKYGLKTNLREYLARTKACLDILFNVEPKFLGEKIEIR